jgi:hypothetical protein
MNTNSRLATPAGYSTCWVDPPLQDQNIPSRVAAVQQPDSIFFWENKSTNRLCCKSVLNSILHIAFEIYMIKYFYTKFVRILCLISRKNEEIHARSQHAKRHRCSRPFTA